MSGIEQHHEQLEKVLGYLSESTFVSLQCLLINIDSEIEMLTELRGEVNERIEYVAHALDLNHKVR